MAHAAVADAPVVRRTAEVAGKEVLECGPALRKPATSRRSWCRPCSGHAPCSRSGRPETRHRMSPVSSVTSTAATHGGLTCTRRTGSNGRCPQRASVRRWNGRHRRRRESSGRAKWPPSGVVMAVAVRPARHCRARDGEEDAPVDRHDMTFRRHVRRRERGHGTGSSARRYIPCPSRGPMGSLGLSRDLTSNDSGACCGTRDDSPVAWVAGEVKHHMSPTIPPAGPPPDCGFRRDLHTRPLCGLDSLRGSPIIHLCPVFRQQFEISNDRFSYPTPSS